jgi:hypothetical protein
MSHPSSGPGVNYGTPAQYVGPKVADLKASVNPSLGEQGNPGGGVNPMGERPTPGSTGPDNFDAAPNDTSKGYPNHNGS